eukprot:CAMPEP_0202449714 /NCGR_PEP_ID=MMETSP1360-20130828/8431_1 /ASSEMBLY_ACC=CAM_ASM_000848 /TAXON_ID=515479 /ORGANISM="Licmophora paradoxa, Strain CCMP2313" /LENGTH=316 /DNA_ID=CAMNT_0049067741 /DNA_START=38 /DNA_END=988 /DNA_ORIENTATION=-
MVDCICLMSALCFLLSNILGVVVVAKELRRPFFDFDLLKDLEPTYLIKEWAHRSSNRPLVQAASVFNAFAWFFFVIPITQLAWALSRGGKRRVGLHTAIAGFALGGALAEFMSRLLVFGSGTASEYIHRQFDLANWIPSSIATSGEPDLIGWRALELVVILTDGLTLWIDAFEWIALFFVMILLYFSVGTQTDEQRGLDMWWARLGLFIGFMTFVDFAIEILRLEDWRTFSQIALAVSFINTVLLLPMWLIWLGFSIQNTLPDYSENIDEWVPLTTMNSTNNTSSAPTTTTTETTSGLTGPVTDASASLPQLENAA